jgi:acetolactate synthase I/II/III large subunit
MRPNDGTRAAAQVLVDQLALHGVRHVFCVPGESYIAALDALHDAPIAVTVCRQEGGAAIMAEARPLEVRPVSYLDSQ